MLQKFRFYISPYFILKFYLLRDIKDVIRKYKFSGSILDFGCGQRPYKNLFRDAVEYVGIDFCDYSLNKDFKEDKPDFHFDENYKSNFNLPFSDAKFDNIVSFQVLEHHRHPQKMISEIVRVVKEGGYILITAPFIGGLHEKPNDFQRFTEYGFKELFQGNNCEILEIKKQGSLFSAIYALFNESLNSFAAKNKLYYFFAVVIYPLFLVSQYFCLLLDKIFKSENVFINYLVLAKKL